MGQSISNHLEDFKDDIMKEAHIIKGVIDISHEEFTMKVKELNKICRKSIECEGRQLQFFIKKGSDSTFLWKQTVRINCMRCYTTTECDVEVYKLLTLRQFLLAHKMIIYHFNCIQQCALPTDEQKNAEYVQVKPLSTSVILDKIMNDTLSDSEECIICMERKPEVTLPCAHSYCLFCIEQWNVSNKTCPVCRAEMENTNESWVTPEIPESSEINAEIQKALTVLTHKLPEK